jgi:glucose-6-phosphate-specific signal transduction histidine kinase
MNMGQNQHKQSSRLLNLLAIASLPAMVLLSLVLFTNTEGGQRKFGIAIFGLLILMPLGALISIFCSFYRRIHPLESGARPKWLPKSMPLLFLLIFFFIAITTVTLMGFGDTLGFYGIMTAWLVLWAGINLALYVRS